MQRDAFDKPSEVASIEGEVVVEGPGSTAMSVTPGAAEVTAARLVKAAATARTQQEEIKDE